MSHSSPDSRSARSLESRLEAPPHHKSSHRSQSHHSSRSRSIEDTEEEEEEKRRRYEYRQSSKSKGGKRDRDGSESPPPPPPPPPAPRERDRDNRRGGGDRERERDRDRDHSRRSSGRDDRYASEDRRRGPPPPSNRSRRSPSYDRGGERERDQPPPSRRQRTESPQLTEEQREMRSVFVSQLSARVGDRELGIFFEQNAGAVRDARVIVDRVSRRSKGVGYVEFQDPASVQKALALSNTTKLLGIPVIVQFTEAEKNRQARDGTGPNGGAPATGFWAGGNQPAGLYVGSLNFALTESDIRQVFQPFGQVEIVDLQKDPLTGKSKGYAFVQFKEAKDAMQALEKMNNFPLAGREIKVGLVSEKGPQAYHRQQQMQESQLDDGTGGNLNHISRIELMQKLSRNDRPTHELPKAPLFRPNIPQATTRNVMLKNAFNAEEETEKDWDLELRDDVKGEVESKYGKVSEIFVVKESLGEIYVRFETVEAATSAIAGLHGRWFGGRQIQATMTVDSLFDAKKP